jgi:protein-S-isoprenylcysteine O-methyltransferase Ste14
MNRCKNDQSQNASTVNWLAAFGKKVFSVRLLVGLGITLVGLEVLVPKPFFAEGQRAVQIAALALIAAGLGLRAWAAGCAGGHTRSEEIQAPSLVTAGPFAYMRNPIYGGTICIGLGMVMLIGDPWGFAFTTIAFVILYVTIVPAEEAFLSRTFGQEYARYRSAVPRFIPRLRAWSGRMEKSIQWRPMLGEVGIALLLALIYSALWFEEYLDNIWG